MIDYTHFLLILPLSFYIFLLLRKILRKEWIKNQKLLTVLKYLLLIPAWAAYFYFVVPFFVPEINNIFKPADSSQRFLVENNEGMKQKFFVSGRLFGSNKWEPVYSMNFKLNNSPILNVEPNEMIDLKIRAGTKDYDIIALNKWTSTAYSNTFKGIAYSVPSQTIKIFGQQFNFKTKLERISIRTQKEILLLLLGLTAVFGIIYHSLSTRGKKWFMIAAYSIYTFFALLSIYLIYQMLTILWYLLR